MARRQTHKMEKLAKIYDTEILPVWAHRFGRLLLRDLKIAPGSQVLDVSCGTGYPSTEIIRRLGDDSRLIAIDDSSAMLDVARTKIEEMGAKNVFFRTESAIPKLSFADDVYDLVISNLGLVDFDNSEKALIDFARVTAPGGEVRCTLPLRGTFIEFFDIYREVLLKYDKPDTLSALQDHIATNFPEVEECYQWLETAGLKDCKVEVEEFTMLFRSSREFFFAPVIEFGYLSDWKKIAGTGQELQDVFWYIKEAIDAYYGDRAFELTVKVGLLKGKKESSVPSSKQENKRLSEADKEALDTLATSPAEEDPTFEETLEPELPLVEDIELDAFTEEQDRPDHLKE